MRASVRRFVVGAVGVVGALVLAPSAQAAFGLANASATPASTNAGANANLTLSFNVAEPNHDLRDLTIHLPPGLIGNPLATVKCTEAELNADDCPAASDVGDVSNSLVANVLGILPVPLTVNGNVYNVVARAGEPARFGIVLNPTPLPIPDNPLLPKIILQSAAALRPTDLGLDTVLKDLPNTATIAGIPTDIDITSLSLTLAGTVGPNGFIRLPTSCRTHTVGFDAVAYDGQTASASATFDTTNCGALPFSPELKARIKRVGPISNPVELSTTIGQTIDEAGLLRAQVALPQAIGGGASALTNVCPASAFEAGSCPEASVVGDAVATSPLLAQSLSGPVAMVEPPTPGLPELGVDLRGPLALKVRGALALTPSGNVVTFDGLPDIPISAFTLTFRGGPGGLISANRDICEPPDLIFNAEFVSHSGATSTTSVPAEIDCSDATGGGGGRGNRKPKAKIKLGRLGSDEPTMKLTVKAGSEKLRQAKLTLPKQLGFARGKDFDRGTSVAKVKVRHTRKALKLKSSKPAKRLRAKLADGALVPGKGLRANSRLRFKLKIRDARGRTTKLTVTGK
jgi:hypothetical protein